jgi:hypothetical protein
VPTQGSFSERMGLSLLISSSSHCVRCWFSLSLEGVMLDLSSRSCKSGLLVYEKRDTRSTAVNNDSDEFEKTRLNSHLRGLASSNSGALLCLLKEADDHAGRKQSIIQFDLFNLPRFHRAIQHGRLFRAAISVRDS